MDYLEIKTLKKQVGKILELHKETRDSDAELVTIVCGKWGYDPIQKASSIERCRRWYQERGFYLPLREETARKRGISIAEWQNALGYPHNGSFTPPSMANVVGKTQSETTPGVYYYIRLQNGLYACTCKDFEYHPDHDCKHIKKYINIINEKNKTS